MSSLGTLTSVNSLAYNKSACFVTGPTGGSETGELGNSRMTDKEMEALKKIDSLLSQFRSSIDPNIPAQMLQTFMAVAMNEGQSLTKIAEVVSANLSTASRHLLELGDRNRKMEPGYGLVARTPDPMNLRQNAYSLTPKGKLLLANILKIMEA